jgi:predicted PurR-regulated permease PerM
MKKQPAFNNSTDLALKLVGFSLAAVVLIFLVYRLQVLIICLILSLVLSSAIAPVAEAADRRKIPRLVTVLTLYVMAGLTYGLVGALLIPAIQEQWQKFISNLPGYLSGIDHLYQHALNMAGNSSDAFSVDVQDVQTFLLKLLRQTLDMSAGVVGLVLNVVLILFLSGYFVIEADRIWTSILEWLPERARPKAARLIEPLAMRMGGYVRGQLLVALAVGAFLVTGFTLLGLKYALLLGILGGMLNLVPYIGAFIATACAVVVAFNQAPLLAGAVLVFYGVEQWVESSFLAPHFLGRQVALHPLVVLLAILFGAALMGIPGALISVPITSAAMFLAEEFYLKPASQSNAAKGRTAAESLEETEISAA